MSSILDLAVATYHAQQELSFEERQSIRALAVEFAISIPAVSNRVSGGTHPARVAQAILKFVISSEENGLVEHIRQMSFSGHPLLHQTTKELVELLCAHWRLLYRVPLLSTVSGQSDSALVIKRS